MASEHTSRDPRRHEDEYGGNTGTVPSPSSSSLSEASSSSLYSDERHGVDLDTNSTRSAANGSATLTPPYTPGSDARTTIFKNTKRTEFSECCHDCRCCYLEKHGAGLRLGDVRDTTRQWTDTQRGERARTFHSTRLALGPCQRVGLNLGRRRQIGRRLLQRHGLMTLLLRQGWLCSHPGRCDPPDGRHGHQIEFQRVRTRVCSRAGKVREGAGRGGGGGPCEVPGLRWKSASGKGLSSSASDDKVHGDVWMRRMPPLVPKLEDSSGI